MELRYIDIIQSELNALKGDYSAFENGEEYINDAHDYSSDLDIFGKHSVFQMCNRTLSRYGSDTLAKWLSEAAPNEIAKARQGAVKEMASSEWRFRFRAESEAFNKTHRMRSGIFDNLDGVKLKFDYAKISPFLMLLSAVSFTFLVLAIIGLIGWLIPVAFYVIHYVINYYVGKTNRFYHAVVSGFSQHLKAYAVLVNSVTSNQWQDPLNRKMAEDIMQEGVSASKLIKKLSVYITNLDLRLNFLIHFPFNLLFFWDIQMINQTEKWRKQYAGKMADWNKRIGEFEALSGLASVAYLNPDWCFPELTAETYELKIEEAVHPLIKAEQRIDNTVDFEGPGCIHLITGSNMAGKSTYLRTAGICVVMARAGSVVSAKSCRISDFKVYTSMRIIDSLEDNTSSFYAELKRLKSLITRVQKSEKVFFLLDEILRGTNSEDRYKGSEALIRQLLKHRANGMIATHDLKLAELEKDEKLNLKNFSFDVRIKGEELYFDYKLHDGVCKSFNASVLMKQMGIEIDKL